MTKLKKLPKNQLSKIKEIKIQIKNQRIKNINLNNKLNNSIYKFKIYNNNLIMINNNKNNNLKNKFNNSIKILSI